MDLPQHTTSRASRRLTRVETLHQSIHHLFNGHSAIGTEPPVRIPATPKNPSLALDTSAAARFDLSPLSPSRYISPTLASISPVSPDEHRSTIYRPLTPTTFRALQSHTSLAPPAPAWPTTYYQYRPQESSGADADVEAAESIAQHQPRKWRQPKPKRQRKPRARYACLPGIQNPRMRRKTLLCLLSGSFLIIVLAIYLGVALSFRNISEEFHVLIILVLVAGTALFSHSLIVLVSLTVHRRRSLRIPHMPVCPGGYAAPETPIRVVLGSDEAALSSGENRSDAPKLAVPPPAYGLWRESVRVDPDRIFWARNADADDEPPTHARRGSATGAGAPRRPPSYVSEGDEEYAVEAVRPSERGRADGASLGG